MLNSLRLFFLGIAVTASATGLILGIVAQSALVILIGLLVLAVSLPTLLITLRRRA